jgi:hypothetical protein
MRDAVLEEGPHPALSRSTGRGNCAARSLVATIATLLLLPVVCHAHPAQLVSAVAHVDENGEFQTRVTFDALAYVLNDTPADVDHATMDQLLDGPTDVLERRLAEARERFGRAVIILCRSEAAADGASRDGSETMVRGEVSKFPEAEDIQRWRDSGRKPRLPVIQEAIVRGRLPAGTTAIAFRFPEVLGSIVLTVERPGEEPYADALEGGRASMWLPVSLDVTALAAGATPQPEARATMPATHTARGARGHVGTSALRYLALGFHHIVPRGPDHILFVLGLFLLSTKLRPLLWQVTAFTVAHSITLGLALYGVLRLPPAVVEPLIAASIAFVAIENLFTSELKPWRPFVVFGFGLVHGLGFAGVLTDAGLPRQQFATALVAFNVGVELGQLAVIAAAFAAVGWWRGKTWYRGVIVVPASCAIALVAVLWTVQRVWNGG